MNDKKKMLEALDLVIVRAQAQRNKGFIKYAEKNNLNYDFFKRKHEVRFTNTLGFCPSTGLLTLYILNKICGPIDKDRVFGFSFCKENNLKPKSVAYIGDDVNDLDIINNAGFSACPEDAFEEVKENVDYVCKTIGGKGAFREFVELIIERSK